jgi:acyl dehydratase
MSSLLNQPQPSLFGVIDPTILLGKTLGQSEWFKVEQEAINEFAVNTKDWDTMHVDPAWCEANSPFGRPIAFGFQTLAMLTHLMGQAIPRPDDQAYALNYGFDRLRLMSPVLVGSEIRATFVLKGFQRKSAKTTLNTLLTTVEIKGESKPALVGDWLVLMVRR